MGSPLLLIPGTSCGRQQYKVRILCFFGMSLVWTFTAQQAHIFGSGIEATGRHFGVGCHGIDGQRDHVKWQTKAGPWPLKI